MCVRGERAARMDGGGRSIDGGGGGGEVHRYMTGTCEGCRGRVCSRPSDALHLLPQLLSPLLPS